MLFTIQWTQMPYQFLFIQIDIEMWFWILFDVLIEIKLNFCTKNKVLFKNFDLSRLNKLNKFNVDIIMRKRCKYCLNSSHVIVHAF